jgi:predicted amidohydrolase
VVYAFIATPVQLWHQHNYVANTACKNAADKKVTVTTAKTTIVDANCAACSHVYSTYSLVADLSLEKPFLVLQPKDACYILSIPFSPILQSSNRGPPELAA